MEIGEEFVPAPLWLSPTLQERVLEASGDVGQDPWVALVSGVHTPHRVHLEPQIPVI